MFTIKECGDDNLINKPMVEMDEGIMNKIVRRIHDKFPEYNKQAEHIAAIIYHQDDYDTSCTKLKLDRYIKDVIDGVLVGNKDEDHEIV